VQERLGKRFGVAGSQAPGIGEVAERMDRFWSFEGKRLKDGLSSIALKRWLKGKGIV
jgi:hypothetical protein